MTIGNWKYDEFVAANDGRFSVLDFIHAVSKAVSLPGDFAICMGHLFAPEMVMFDGVIVLSEWFDENRYQRYRNDGMQRGEAQAWINMVELTGIFDGIALDKARELAVFIAQLWNDRIDQRFPGEATRANVVSGEDSDEIFVTIGKFPAMPRTSG